MKSWLSLSNKGISYSRVAICFIFLCCEKGAYSNAYNRFNSYSFEPFLLESIVRQTGRGHPDTYTRMAEWQTRWSQTPLSQDVRVQVPQEVPFASIDGALGFASK